jgi:phosphatidate phosphatase LPIN
MKLGEGGEAFFVFQTEGDIPEDMQTSPVVSPSQSPILPAALTGVFSLRQAELIL